LIARVVRNARHDHYGLGLSSGRPGPHDFAVRKTPFVRANEKSAHDRFASTAFLPHATDDPDAPLGWTGIKITYSDLQNFASDIFAASKRLVTWRLDK
jgi:hypothetical protein